MGKYGWISSCSLESMECRVDLEWRNVVWFISVYPPWRVDFSFLAFLFSLLFNRYPTHARFGVVEVNLNVILIFDEQFRSLDADAWTPAVFRSYSHHHFASSCDGTILGQSTQFPL